MLTGFCISLEKCLIQILCPFSLELFLLCLFVHCLIGLFVFLSLSGKSSLYVLYPRPLSDIRFGNLFLSFCKLSFYFLDYVFRSTKVLVLMKSNLFFLWLLVHLVLHVRDCCLVQGNKDVYFLSVQLF